MALKGDKCSAFKPLRKLRGVNSYGRILRSIQRRLVTFQLESLRGWFTALPTSFCSSDSGLVAKEGEPCWNGTQTAPYTKKVAGDGLANQNGNPEYQADRFLPYRGECGGFQKHITSNLKWFSIK